MLNTSTGVMDSGLALRAPRNDRSYLFRPSIGVIVSFASSMPSMQLTLSATTSVPSGFLPRANDVTPHVEQNRWSITSSGYKHAWAGGGPPIGVNVTSPNT